MDAAACAAATPAVAAANANSILAAADGHLQWLVLLVCGRLRQVVSLLVVCGVLRTSAVAVGVVAAVFGRMCDAGGCMRPAAWALVVGSCKEMG